MFRALIPCAGVGERMGAGKPKQFLTLKGIPIFVHTLRAFEFHPLCAGIYLVVHKDYLAFVEKNLYEFGVKKIETIVEGGPTRQESVYNGLRQMDSNEGIVLVHDAVRPLVEERIITNVYLEALNFSAAIPVIPVRDAIIKESDGYLGEPLSREGLFLVQTPQGAKSSILMECMERAKIDGLNFPDEGSLLHHYGYRIKLVEGSSLNIKITYPQDLLLAERLLSS
ncbi:MAG: 2-C-methyl-D-erythritol 4-phosphate cytidylyltransferase [Caldimicrobium sp.]|nr:2-C-methyl-D-erythritol 4-phosphate cytidylyltransferase [Caldimicrobium sp.]MCX7613944.1 2-C-methyl-D-erythritol 4-phosphate cytidylyltransferase [Caldimicrobium sp.]MDW8183352.1 2-C-methyl-D-erythritol 4-phosphate cytidylyltransferase [Caldimicrobium sp.]